MQDAVGEGPVVFFTKQGRQVVYDLGAIKFDAAGVPGIAGVAVDDQESLTEWLQELVQEGRLTPAPNKPPAPVEVLQITAARAGEIGNGIVVEVAAGSAADKVDVTVTWSVDHRDLTLATLGADLTGANVAFVQLDNLPAGDLLPDAAPPQPPVGGKWGVIGTDAGGAPQTAFTLEPRAGTSVHDQECISVGVSQVVPAPAGAGTFTLNTVFQAVAKDVTSATLGDIAVEAGFAISVVVPVSAAGALPALGTFTLNGATATVAATKASATILSQQ